MVNDLRKLSRRIPAYPPVVFFYQETRAEGEAFFRKAWAEARAVSDPEKIFYHAFEVQRGGWREFTHPRMLLATLRATGKGNFVGKTTSDPLMMPGAFLVYDEHILWQYDFKHAGDHPDFEALLQHLPEEIEQANW